MTQKKHYRSVFAFIFGTYFALCFVVICIAGFGYANDYRTLKEHVLRLGGQQAEQIMAQLDSELDRIDATLSILSTNTVLKEMMGKSDQELSRDATGITKLMAELKTVMQMDSRLHLLVWFQDSNSIFDTGLRRYNTALMDLFYQTCGLTEESFHSIMGGVGDDYSYAFEDGRVWLMRSVFDSRYRKRAVLIIEIDMNSFMDIRSGEEIFILSAGDHVIYTSGMNREYVVESYTDAIAAAAEQSAGGNVPEADGDYVKKDGFYFVSHTMKHTGWNCCMGIAERSLWDGLHTFRVILLLELAGAALLVTVLSLYNTWKMYAPIGRMLQLLDAGQEVKFKDTYGMLSAKLEGLLSDNHRMHKHAKNSRIFLDNYQMQRIVNGEITSVDTVAEGMERFTGIGRQEAWVLALIKIPVREGSRPQPRSPYEPGKELDLQFFVLQNIVHELILERFLHGGIYWQDDHYCLFVGLGEGGFDELKEKLEYMANFYENVLQTALCIEAGQPMEGFALVRDQYVKLLEELKYHIFWQGQHNQVWLQQSVVHDWQQSSFGDYVNASRRLYNFLQAEEYGKAYETLDCIFQENFSRDPKYLKYNIYRMYGLAAMLTMAIEEQTNGEDRAFFEALSFEERLGGVDSVEAFMSTSRELFDQIMQYKSEKGKDAPAWLCEVTAFLQENYRNPNLSVADLADRFWISVPHLSRTFKKYMGNSVLEYIQLLRVGEAKRLLAEGSHVTETARQVGYLDAKALTRAFKRHEGITPGKYRELTLQSK